MRRGGAAMATATAAVLVLLGGGCSSKSGSSDGGTVATCGLRPLLDAAAADAGDGSVQPLSTPLPACAVNGHAGYADGGTTDACGDALDFGGAELPPETFSLSAEGCVVSDAGAPEGPAGGTLLDGDYDLVRFRSNVFASSEHSRRTLRVFDGGTYAEWLVENGDPTTDGGADNFRYDTGLQVSGNTLEVRHACGAVTPTSTYGFTANGDELTLFYYRNATGPLDSIYTFQRTCAR
jgi:hypothetical protein